MVLRAVEQRESRQSLPPLHDAPPRDAHRMAARHGRYSPPPTGSVIVIPETVGFVVVAGLAFWLVLKGIVWLLHRRNDRQSRAAVRAQRRLSPRARLRLAVLRPCTDDDLRARSPSASRCSVATACRTMSAAVSSPSPCPGGRWKFSTSPTRLQRRGAQEDRAPRRGRPWPPHRRRRGISLTSP